MIPSGDCVLAKLGVGGRRGVCGVWQQLVRRRGREKNRDRISFGLGRDLSEGGGSWGHGPKAAGWEALDELPSLFLSPRRSSVRRLGLGSPLGS